MTQALVKAAQQGATTGEDDAAVHDVAGELRRGAVEGGLDRGHDCVHGLVDGPADLLGSHHDRAGQAGDEVTATDLGVVLIRQREGGADRHLDLFSGALAQHQRVLLFHVLNDRVVELIAAYSYGQTRDDAAKRDDGDLGGTATDIDDHVAGGLVNRQGRTDCRSHGLFDDEDLACACCVAGIFNRALLDTGDAGRYADDQAGLGEVTARMHLLDEVAQHALSGVEVGDDAVLERANSDDIARRAPDHSLGLRAHREDSAGVVVDRDNRGLVQHDATTTHVNERVGSAEVDGHVAADEG